jgi:hypothetical protein
MLPAQPPNFAAHLRHQEGHVQHVHAVGQDVVARTGPWNTMTVS